MFTLKGFPCIKTFCVGVAFGSDRDSGSFLALFLVVGGWALVRDS